MELKDIEIVDLSTLKPDERNAREHSRRNLEEIGRSLKEFGQHRLFVVQRGTRKIIVGNGMYREMLAGGETEGAVLWVDDADEKAIRRALADNRTSDLSGFDSERLARLMAEAKGEIPGWNEAEINKLLDQLERAGGGKDSDAIPPEPEKVVSRLGDLWILGDHRLICGDSTDAATVKRLLGGEIPLLMVTDPPYGVNYDPSWRRGRFGGENMALGLVKNDDRADWLAAYKLFPGDVAYVWHGALFTHVVAKNLIDCGFDLRSQIIWVKDHLIISRADYHWQHEACWYAVRRQSSGHYDGGRAQTTAWDDIVSTAAIKGYEETKAHGEAVGFFDAPRSDFAAGRMKRLQTLELKKLDASRWQGGNRQSDTWRIANRDQDCRTIHSTQKPMECMKRPIVNNSRKGELVYEPFCGSGTTLIAAEAAGRKCRAVELDPVYVDVIVDRWQRFTGGRAILCGDGRTFAEIGEARHAG
ncbi:DNA modification methylase [Pyramidobacter piscolens]|uniref:DNA modification methylase n=1 Tax=Pyramidobacter piscolens TaxID=638849 RepID=UPI0024925C3D|nr:DNA modification methylase [Pyramidobacter piscolens]